MQATVFPAMSETMIVIIVVLALICGTLLAYIFWPRRPLTLLGSLGANDELKHFAVSETERTSWFGGVLAALILVGGLSYMAQRDDVALATERAAERRAEFERILARAGCPDKRDGDSNVITFAIESTADPASALPYKVVACSRIVDNGWFRQEQRAKKKALIVEAEQAR